MQTITLKSGIQMPILGLGTDGVIDIANTIPAAINLGYRLIDTASTYGNHDDIGKAIKHVERSNLFICTKINNQTLENTTTTAAIEKIFLELDTSYIDLLLIHNPTVKNIPQLFKELIHLKAQGKIKSLGVSNFAIKHLEHIKEDIAHIDINQIECHPYLFQYPLMDYCKQHHITVMAYRPFGAGVFAHDEILLQLAKTHKTTVHKICLSWLAHQQIPAVASSNSIKHLADNLQSFAIKLANSEIEQINGLNKNIRTCTGPWADFE